MGWLFKNSEEKNAEKAQYEFEYAVSYDRQEEYAKAFKCYKKAAELGHPEAMCGLGECFEEGKGTQKNLSEAFKWYKEATDKGSIYAPKRVADMLRYGNGADANSEEAIRYYKIGVQRGDAYAMTDYAYCLYYGKGVEKNYEKAYNVIAQANNKVKNYGFAQCMLGLCFEEGNGVEKNLTKALEWYKKAMQNGSVNGKEKYESLKPFVQEIPKQENVDEKILNACKRGRYSDAVGICLLNADKNPSYLQKALKLTCQAAALIFPKTEEAYEPGIPNAESIPIYERAREIERVGQNFTEAYQYYEKAALLKHPEAIYRASIIGRRVKGNYEKWKREAELIKHPFAVDNWAAIYSRIQNGDTDALKKLNYYGDEEAFKASKMCLAYIYSRRAAKGDVEAVYSMETGYKDYLLDGFNEWKKNLPLLENYGLWWYHKAIEVIDYDDSEQKKEKIAYAERAIQYGVLCAQEEIDRVTSENRIRVQQRAAENKRKAKALEEYKQKLDDKERWFNLATEGRFRTEQDAYFEGGRDAWDSALYERYRDKKIKDFEKELDSE